jgi:hypothetical protein
LKDSFIFLENAIKREERSYSTALLLVGLIGLEGDGREAVMTRRRFWAGWIRVVWKNLA